MIRAAPEVILRRLLLAAVLVNGPALLAQDLDLTPGMDPFGNRDVEKDLLDEITRIEAREGAYSADLPEQMLSLGLALQEQERHGEAVDVFKRGVHLARINNGLYCADQIPLLQGVIRSSIALGEYARVDELQQYLYRVQLRGQASGEARASGLIQQATWQFNAYRLGLGEQGAGRLVNMWDLYQLAWSDIEAAEGEISPKLLAPLYGMLRTQYLISQYQASSEEPGNSFKGGGMSTNLNRFYAYRSQNYELGKTVILAIYKIEASDKGKDSNEAADALVAMGDWALWHDRREDANKIYQLAMEELADRDDAKQEEERLFAQPVALPDIKGLRNLPPAVRADQGNILVEFEVDSRGKVVKLERLDNNEEIDAKADRLMRALRNTKFRPRFEAGEPVGSDKLVRAYEIKP